MLSDYRKMIRRRELMTFLASMVVPEDFSSEYVVALSNEINTQQELCEYFELGRGLETIMAEIDFDVEDFLAFLLNEAKIRERLLEEDYLELQETYRSMTKGGTL